VAEYFLAILAVQSPLRHSVTLWRGAGLAVTNNAKTQQIENVQKGTREKLTFRSLFASGQIYQPPEWTLVVWRPERYLPKRELKS
jgi:hypothetical protein